MTRFGKRRQYGNKRRTKAALRADDVIRQCWARRPERDAREPRDDLFDGDAA